MILGLLFPNAASESLWRRTAERRHEKPHRLSARRNYLYRYLTAIETLDFFGALFGQSVEMRRERSKQLLEMVGLAHAFNRPVGEFSKGMARRIGLAQALVNDPDLVILDEPTSGLDPIGCREVKDVIRLLASRGKTIILCSHLLADVQDVCDDMVVLYGGKIRAAGAMDEILCEEDKSRIVCPSLSEETVRELRAWLASKGISNDDEISIDHPVRDLEDFFLEVVRQAREQSVDTAGVQAGGEIPDYLADQGTAILAALKRAKPPQPQRLRLRQTGRASHRPRAPRTPRKTEPAATTPEPEPDLDADAQAAKEAANVKLATWSGKNKPSKQQQWHFRSDNAESAPPVRLALGCYYCRHSASAVLRLYGSFFRLVVRTRYSRSVKPPAVSKSAASRAT